jgi:hypothetical protein
MDSLQNCVLWMHTVCLVIHTVAWLECQKLILVSKAFWRLACISGLQTIYKQDSAYNTYDHLCIRIINTILAWLHTNQSHSITISETDCWPVTFFHPIQKPALWPFLAPRLCSLCPLLTQNIHVSTGNHSWIRTHPLQECRRAIAFCKIGLFFPHAQEYTTSKHLRNCMSLSHVNLFILLNGTC